MLEGNINDSVQNVLKTTHLFDPFPPELDVRLARAPRPQLAEVVVALGQRHHALDEVQPFIMPAEYVRQYTKILQGGIWCILRIQYTHPIDDDFADPFEEPAPASSQRL